MEIGKLACPLDVPAIHHGETCSFVFGEVRLPIFRCEVFHKGCQSFSTCDRHSVVD